MYFYCNTLHQKFSSVKVLASKNVDVAHHVVDNLDLQASDYSEQNSLEFLTKNDRNQINLGALVAFLNGTSMTPWANVTLPAGLSLSRFLGHTHQMCVHLAQRIWSATLTGLEKVTHSKREVVASERVHVSLASASAYIQSVRRCSTNVYSRRCCYAVLSKSINMDV